MKAKAATIALLVIALAPAVFAGEGAVPKGVPPLDHVFVIMMENHGYSQIVNNPSAPFANQLAGSANSATNYFAIGHPSLTNYLEVVGGSNFGARTDNSPDWHDAACITNLASGLVATDNPSSPDICPISGTGTDAATPVVDLTNECPTSTVPCPPGLNSIDGIHGVPAAPDTAGKTIADQLAERGMSWKSYQESLPPTGADGVNNSDGFFTDSAGILAVLPNETQTLINLYAVKHNPFAYFRSVQEGESRNSSLKNIVGFEGAAGLFDDLASGRVPAFSFIAPNQCNDQHGRSNAGPQCDFDPNDNGTQQGLNPALIYLGDLALRNIVAAIHSSPAWQRGNNAIVVLWDENDYSFAPTNQVLLIVDTNHRDHGAKGARSVQSGRFYTHFSLLKSLEAGFGLPCLNHACDDNVSVMSDLFGEDEHGKGRH
jgi:phosphatidylinositol-3-phosphatase